MPKPIRETRVIKLVFITIPCLKFWALLDIYTWCTCTPWPLLIYFYLMYMYTMTSADIYLSDVHDTPWPLLDILTWYTCTPWPLLDIFILCTLYTYTMTPAGYIYLIYTYTITPAGIQKDSPAETTL